MSWFGNTLLPTIEGVFWGAGEFPRSPEQAAALIRAAGHPQEADYIARMSALSLRGVYESAGLLHQENDAWAMAEDEWCNSAPSPQLSGDEPLGRGRRERIEDFGKHLE